jgi:hypothetical protein
MQKKNTSVKCGVNFPLASWDGRLEIIQNVGG